MALSEIKSLVRSNFFDIFVILAVILLLLILWALSLESDLLSPPIVIGSYTTPEDQKKDLLPNSEPRLGNSGYALSTLGQACDNQFDNLQYGNLPFNFKSQKCDESEGLACIYGVVDGGGICLKNINAKCQNRTDCSPDAPLCIEGICQESFEVINTPCLSDSDCKGTSQAPLNHVCDPNLKICKFDFYPNDSGCTSDTQCVLYDAGPDNVVRCLNTKNLLGYKGEGESPNVLNVAGTSPSEVITKGLYVIVNPVLDPDLTARYLVLDSSVSGGVSPVTSISLLNFDPQPGTEYNLGIGGNRDGICVVDFPLGTKIVDIEFTSPGVCYNCENTLDTVGGYCVEKGRKFDNSTKTPAPGVSGEVCDFSGNIPCQSGLKCTYSENLVNTLKTNENYQPTTELIGVTNVEDVGICTEQISERFEVCNNITVGCIPPNVCQVKSVNSLNSSFCGPNWELLEYSPLVGCPANYGVSGLECLSKTNNICFEDSDCLTGKCSNNNVENIYRYDKLSDTFSSLLSTTSLSGVKRNLIMTKDYYLDSSEVQQPSAFGYWSRNSNQVTCVLRLENRPAVTLNFIINSSKYKSTPVDLSIIKIDDTTHQLNLIYSQEYQNYRKITYPVTNSGLSANSGLAVGSSVFFTSSSSPINEYQVYTLSNVDTSGVITNVIDSAGNSISFPSGFTTNVVSFDSKVAINNNSSTDYLSFDTCGLVKSDKVSFYDFGNNTTINGIQTGFFYYSIVERTGSETRVMLSDSLKEVNMKPDQTSLTTTVTTPFGSDNGYLQPESVFGVKVFPYRLQNTTGSVTVTIDEDDLVERTGNVSLNSPVGYFTDSSDFSVDVGVSDILVTSKLNSTTNQVTNVSYNLGSSIVDISEDMVSHYTLPGISDVYMGMSITNSYSIPNLKIYSKSGASISYNRGTSFPYQIDKVRNYGLIDTSYHTANFFSTYQNIQPSSYETLIANESKLRKIGFSNDSDITYSGVTSNGNPGNLSVNPIPDSFGFSTPIQISSFNMINFTTESDPGKNYYFLRGTQLFFTNPNDIDVLLKYSSSDLVIGFVPNSDITSNTCTNFIGLTNIQDYFKNRITGNETLIYNINIYIDNPTLSEYKTYLFVNNIVPMSFDTSSNEIQDGRLLVTSCYTTDSQTSSVVAETSYNYILAPGVGIFPVVVADSGTNYPANFFPKFVSFTFNESIFNVNPSGFQFPLVLTLPGGVTFGSVIYLVNSNFLSFLGISNFTPGSDGITLLNEDRSIINKDKSKGNTKMYINTVPFYNGIADKQGILDQTFKTPLPWPSWLNELNTSNNFKFLNMIVSFNPGNIENTMFYYCLVQMGDSYMFVYLSSNLNSNSVVFSQPVPMVLNKIQNDSELNERAKNMFMTPYDKKLYLLGGKCG